MASATVLASSDRDVEHGSLLGLHGGGAGLFSVLTGRPLSIPIVLVSLSLLSIFFGVFSGANKKGTTNVVLLVVSVALQCGFSSLNDLSVSLLNELTALSFPPKQWQSNQALGQFLRRVGNCLTAFTAPLLFEQNAALPYAGYGCVLLAWAGFVWAGLYAQARTIAPDATPGVFPPITGFAPFAGDAAAWREYELSWLRSRQESQHAAVRVTGTNIELELARLRAEVKELKKAVATILPSQSSATNASARGAS